MVRPDDWPRIPPLLSGLGYEELAGPIDLSNIRIRRLTKIADEDVLLLDFLLADGHYSKALDTPVYFTVRGLQVPVVNVPTLIELKRGRMSAKDASDIEGLQKLLPGASQ